MIPLFHFIVVVDDHNLVIALALSASIGSALGQLDSKDYSCCPWRWRRIQAHGGERGLGLQSAAAHSGHQQKRLQEHEAPDFRTHLGHGGDNVDDSARRTAVVLIFAL